METFTIERLTDDEFSLLFSELRRYCKAHAGEFDPWTEKFPEWSGSIWQDISTKLALVGKHGSSVTLTRDECQAVYEVMRRCVPGRSKKYRRAYGRLLSLINASGFRPVMHT
jgi:hypothetical protein